MFWLFKKMSLLSVLSLPFFVAACGDMMNPKTTSLQSSSASPSPAKFGEQPDGSIHRDPNDRVVLPFSNSKQSEAEIEQTFQRKGPYSISVVFKDEYKIRAVAAPGGNKLIALADKNDAFAALQAVLQQYKVESYSVVTLGKTEAELAADEQKRERLAGWDVPNDGSWTTITLVSPTKEELKSLTLALQKELVVRSVQLSAPVIAGL
jgi:hypothetical protein